MTISTTPKIKLSKLIAPSFYDVHKDIKHEAHTHYWYAGGRGSTKSSEISIELIMGIMKDPNANAVVLRKVKETLKDSVFDQLCWAITALGVDAYWNIPESKLVLTYLPTGQQIRFRGADKPKKIKSIKFSKGYCKYIWYEELDEFSGMEEIRMINQSLMRGGEKFIIFYSYNPPQSANNWVNAEVKLTRPDRLAHHSTYLTVPREWLGEQFIIEANTLKELKPKAYEHEYLGEVTGTGGEVFENVNCRPITNLEIESFEQINQALDFGFATDPSAYVKLRYDRKHRKIFIFDEIYGTGMTNDDLCDEIEKKNTDNEVIRADSAEPKSILEMNQRGLRIIGVKKGKDSIKYGIKFLQDLFEIVIDDKRCPNTAREFLQYELDKDVNGNFKPNFPDHDNHSIDSVRYALNDEIMFWKEEKKNQKKQLPFAFRTDDGQKEGYMEW